ncbi:MAG: maleylpyruvate isomerase family mycothiol-dependent enzyme [Streptosporangiaceae bacterium]
MQILDRDRATAAADRGARQFCALLEQADRPGAPAIGIWSVRDVAAHLTGVTAYTAMLRGVPSPARSIDAIAAWNASTVSRVAQLDCASLAPRIRRDYADFLEEACRHPADELVSWHGDLKLPVATLCAILAGEAYIHGWDVARGLHVPWWLDPQDMRTIFVGLLPVLPHYVDPRRAAGCTATFDVRLRGDPPARAVLVFTRGQLTVQAHIGQRAHCRISADPATYLLVTYGRSGPLIPALTGRITASGGKPWLALRLPRMFRKP